MRQIGVLSIAIRTVAVFVCGIGGDLVRPCAASELWQTGWTKSATPVLTLSAAGSFDSQNIFAPAIAKHNGTYYLYYSGGPSGPLTGEGYINYQLGVANSTDGVNFVKHGQPCCHWACPMISIRLRRCCATDVATCCATTAACGT